MHSQLSKSVYTILIILYLQEQDCSPSARSERSIMSSHNDVMKEYVFMCVKLCLPGAVTSEASLLTHLHTKHSRTLI